jgi:hypothetical protein
MSILHILAEPENAVRANKNDGRINKKSNDGIKLSARPRFRRRWTGCINWLPKTSVLTLVLDAKGFNQAA